MSAIDAIRVRSAQRLQNGAARLGFFVIVWLAMLSADSVVLGGDLTLVTSANPGSPLVITPLEAGADLAISVINASSDDPPELYLTGWQFRLVIRPDDGTTGSLSFGVGSTPDNYVLDAVPHLGPASAEVDGVFTALDTQTSLPLSGVEVPQSPGANLIRVALLPTSDARGVFGVYALDGMNALWLDATQEPGAQTHSFLNIPSGGGDVRIADVLVTSPADFNRSMAVDDLDLARWTLGFGREENAESLDGDADGDKDVDGGDLLVWQSELGWGAVEGTPLESTSASTPEPATHVLACLLALSLPAVRGRRGR